MQFSRQGLSYIESQWIGVSGGNNESLKNQGQNFLRQPHCPEEEMGQGAKVCPETPQLVLWSPPGVAPAIPPLHFFPWPQVPGMQEILLIGFYQPDEALTQFLEAAQQEFHLPVRCANMP